MICADELGPVIPRNFPPAPGWTTDGHRVKAELDYGRGPQKTWVFGALRPADGQVVTRTGPSRNSAGYQDLLAAVEAATTGRLVVVHRQPVHRGCSDHGEPHHTGRSSKCLVYDDMPSRLWRDPRRKGAIYR